MSERAAGTEMPSAPQGQSGCLPCAASASLRALAENLRARGLECHLVTYKGPPDDGDTEEIVVTNPLAKERGEIRVGDDGMVSWERFGSLDEAGTAKVLDDVTNCLRGTGVRSSPAVQS